MNFMWEMSFFIAILCGGYRKKVCVKIAIYIEFPMCMAI